MVAGRGVGGIGEMGLRSVADRQQRRCCKDRRFLAVDLDLDLDFRSREDVLASLADSCDQFRKIRHAIGEV